MGEIFFRLDLDYDAVRILVVMGSRTLRRALSFPT